MNAEIPGDAARAVGTSGSSNVNAGDLPRIVYFGWALGPLGATLIYIPYTSLFMRFMTDYLAIPAVIGGLMMGSAKFIDAGSDILVGILSDRTRSRWGRRRPYLFLGGFLNALAFIPLFWVPASLSLHQMIPYLMIAIFFFSVSSAIWYVPYIAMTAEMTTSYHGRSVLVSYRVMGSAIGQLMGGGIAAWLIVYFGSNRMAHAEMALIYSVIGLFAFMSSLFLTRKAPTTERHPGKPYTLKQQFVSASQNRPFFMLLSMKILYFFGLASYLGSNTYFIKYNLGLSDDWLGTFLFVNTVSIILSLPIWLRAAKILEKRTLIGAAFLINATVYLSWLLTSKNDPVIFALMRYSLTGFCVGGINLMVFSMLPDAMEYDYLRTGLRREGLFAGFVTLIEKASSALGVAAIGILMGLMGYVSSTAGRAIEQPHSALTAIYFAFAGVPALMGLGCFAIISRYDLTKSKLIAMRLKGPPTQPAQDTRIASPDFKASMPASTA